MADRAAAVDAARASASPAWRGELGLAGDPAARATARGRRPRRRRSSRPSSRERLESDLERGFTGHGPAPRRPACCAATGGSSAPTARRASSDWPCSALLLAERDAIAAVRSRAAADAARRRHERARSRSPPGASSSCCALAPASRSSRRPISSMSRVPIEPDVTRARRRGGPILQEVRRAAAVELAGMTVPPAPGPRSLALEAVRDELAPETLLADVQRAWPEVVGGADRGAGSADRGARRRGHGLLLGVGLGAGARPDGARDPRPPERGARRAARQPPAMRRRGPL